MFRRSKQSRKLEDSKDALVSVSRAAAGAKNPTPTQRCCKLLQSQFEESGFIEIS